MTILLWVSLTIGFAVFGYGALLARSTRTSDAASPQKRLLGDLGLREGLVRLVRHARIVSLPAFIIASVLGMLVFLTTHEDQNPGARAVLAAGSFLVGALATDLNSFVRRTLWKHTYPLILTERESNLAYRSIAVFRSSAASGLLTVALSLLGVASLFALCAVTGVTQGMQDAPSYLTGYGCGASFSAIFMQLARYSANRASGGANSVRETNAAAWEDIAYDQAVHSTDLVASVAVGVIGAMLLGAALANVIGNNAFVYFPLAVGAFGLLASMIGVASVRFQPSTRNVSGMLNRGYLMTTVMNAASFATVCYVMFHGDMRTGTGGNIFLIGIYWRYIALAGCVGIAACVAFVYLPQYFLLVPWQIAHVMTVLLTIGSGFYLGVTAQVTGNMLQDGVFGVAVTTVGMLMSAGYNLVIGTYTQVIGAVSSIGRTGTFSAHVRKEINALDRIGDTATIYAVGLAALGAFLLVYAYLDQVAVFRGYPPGTDGWNATHRVDLAQPKVFIGAFLGLLSVYLFSSLSLQTLYTIRNVLVPGAFVLLFPIFVGVVLRAEGGAGFLTVAVIGGILLTFVSLNGRSSPGDAKRRVGAMIPSDVRTLAPHMLMRFSGALLLMLVPLFI